MCLLDSAQRAPREAAASRVALSVVTGECEQVACHLFPRVYVLLRFGLPYHACKAMSLFAITACDLAATQD